MNALALPPELATRVRRDEPMSKHTSWHVGGPADLFFRPLDANDLAAFLRSLAPDTPVMWIGLGSTMCSARKTASITSQKALFCLSAATYSASLRMSASAKAKILTASRMTQITNSMFCSIRIGR